MSGERAICWFGVLFSVVWIIGILRTSEQDLAVAGNLVMAGIGFGIWLSNLIREYQK